MPIENGISFVWKPVPSESLLKKSK